MARIDVSSQPQAPGLSKVWGKTPVLIRAILMIILVGMLGANGISVFAIALPAPLAVIATLVFLFIYWKFFSGSWGPKNTAENRRKHSRAGSLSSTQWKWSLVLGALFVLVFQSGLMVTFRLIQFPAERFIQGFGFESAPPWLAWGIIITAALSAGLTEEVGFRGYGQVLLEERYGPVLANIIISLVFVVFHLHQAWAAPLLLHLFVASYFLGALAYATGSLLPGIIAHAVLDIFNFSYWWSNVAGQFKYQPIALTGADLHFVVWLLVLITSSALFVWGLGRVKKVGMQN